MPDHARILALADAWLGPNDADAAEGRTHEVPGREGLPLDLDAPSAEVAALED